MPEIKTQKKKHTLTGKIVSDKMKDTAVVLVERLVKHKKYGKFIRKSKRYKVHNSGNIHKIGEVVVIEECRPMSRDKHFRIVSGVKSLKAEN